MKRNMSDQFRQTQEQLQQQKLAQTISHQQLLQTSLVELPLAQLVDRVNMEMNDNPALEQESPYDNPDHQDYADGGDYNDGADSADDDYEVLTEREERQSALDDALSNIGRDDDELPVYQVATLWLRNAKRWCMVRPPRSMTS